MQNVTNYQYLLVQPATGLTTLYRRGAFTASVVAAMPTINTWHHVVTNYDRTGNMELFVDNISQGTVAINAAVSPAQGLQPMQHTDSGVPGVIGCPFYLASYALHGELMSGADRARSYTKRIIGILPTTLCAYIMRRAVFNSGTTGFILNTADEGADGYQKMSGAVIGEYSCLSRRGVGTDLFTVMHPDLSFNGNDDYQWGIDNTLTQEVIRYAADSFFWRAG